MLDPIDRENLPQATVAPQKRRRISVIWIIPICAAIVAIGIAIHSILSEGPTITIVFKAAQGVEAGKTFVKYKDVNITTSSGRKIYRYEEVAPGKYEFVGEFAPDDIRKATGRAAPSTKKVD